MTSREDLGSLASLPVHIEARLDERLVTMRDLVALRPGSLLRLDRSAGEHIDVLAGGAILGHGEIVVVESVLGVRVTDFYEEE
jgi:flagellar motor switch protein FliN